jgi:flagellar hook-length control protein FliK
LPQAPAQPPVQTAQLTTQDFSTANHDRIVTGVRSQLLPNGGSMHIQLDPPQLGSMEITVRMVDGAMSAAFRTSNDQATQLLSHSLGQLKQSLESQGVNVDKLHVEQMPRDQKGSASGEDKQQGRQPAGQEASAQRDQQRREMLQRLWRKLRLGRDPLDTVA